MTQSSAGNPNICLDCERIAFDDSPVLAASAAQESIAEGEKVTFVPELEPSLLAISFSELKSQK